MEQQRVKQSGSCRLRWHSHEAEVVLSVPVSLKREKTKEFALPMRADVLVMAGMKDMVWLLAYALRYLLTFR
jgi:hypothetical protein